MHHHHLLLHHLTNLSTHALQSLNWEAASGLVRTIARYSDGSTSDITNRAALTLAKPATSFAVTIDPVYNVPVATVTAQVGTCSFGFCHNPSIAVPPVQSSK
jgi:hypothetical protein